MEEVMIDYLVNGLCRRMTVSTSTVERLNKLAHEFINSYPDIDKTPQTWKEWEKFVLPHLTVEEVMSLRL